jgi:hypothetical protein
MIYLFSKTPRPGLGTTKLSIQGVQEALSSGVKWPVREADHSPPFSVEVKNEWSFTLTPSTRLFTFTKSDWFCRTLRHTRRHLKFE